MCGRFELHSSLADILREFRARTDLNGLAPRYNIAPTQDIVIVRNEAGNELVECTWGFPAPAAKGVASGRPVINARVETVAMKPMFRNAFRNGRCLVVADGFYEWQIKDGLRRPMHVHQKSGRPFGMAGVCGAVKTPEGKTVCACVIITAEASETIRPIHVRMPLIVSEDMREAWLDPDGGSERLTELLTAPQRVELEYREVSTKVNSPFNQGPDLIVPV